MDNDLNIGAPEQKPILPEPIKKLNNKILLISAIAIVAISALTVNFLIFKKTSPVSTNNTDKNSISIPQLFADVQWQETPLTSSESRDFPLEYNNYSYVKELAQGQSKSTQLAGRLWTADIKNLSDSQLSNISDKFNNYYSDESLKTSGWVRAQKLDDRQLSFQGVSADGVTGSAWGYIKIQNQKLKLLSLGYFITDFTDASNGGPLEIKCPCTLELQVFASDEADVNNFSLK